MSVGDRGGTEVDACSMLSRIASPCGAHTSLRNILFEEEKTIAILCEKEKNRKWRPVNVITRSLDHSGGRGLRRRLRAGVRRHLFN
tara:strand:- start:341 stop:598 length:258 start_codon:yes stop_codon:yes gene_type:complete